MNFIGVISEIGGLAEILFITFSIIPILINNDVAEKKFIKKLYFVEKEK